VARGGLRAGPETLQVNLGNRCNTRCIFCWNHSPLRPAPGPEWLAQRMSDAHLENVIASLPALRPGRLVLSGRGEPLLHPGARALIGAACSEGIPVAIQTNGVAGLEPEELVELGVDHLAVNVSAGTPGGYERTHPGHGRHFAKVLGRLERIAQLRQAGARPRVSLVAVIQRSNAEELAHIVGLAHRVGASSVELKGMELSAGLEPLALGAAERGQVALGLEEAGRVARELGVDLRDGHLAQVLASRPGNGAFTEGLEHGPCYMGWYYLRVTCDGRVMFCCKDKLMGHLDARGLYHTWRSPAYHLERLAARDGDTSTGLLGPRCRACSNFERNREIGAIVGSRS
jgi:MoaA/NifB/PqqE/SkfB family radical SAM enzyme